MTKDCNWTETFFSHQDHTVTDCAVSILLKLKNFETLVGMCFVSDQLSPDAFCLVLIKV